MKRRDRRAQRRNGTGLTTSDESEPDSAFPARTPEQQNIKVKNSACSQTTHMLPSLSSIFKALDDLLEEEVPVPGDSGRGSVYPGHPGWAFLGG